MPYPQTNVTAFDGINVPTRADPTNWNERGEDAWARMKPGGDQMNVLASQVNVMATAASSSADAAASSAGNAATSAGQAEIFANAAAVSAGVPFWVSGTNYVTSPTPSVVVDPTDFRTYRRRVAGAGTTAPSLDPANWRLISAGSFPLLHVREEKTPGAGQSSGTSVAGHQTRILNTVKTNTIAGASLANNQITLPPGRYRVRGRVPGGASTVQGSLRNITDSAYALIGSSEQCGGSTSVNSTFIGEISIATAKVFEVDHYTFSPSTSPHALGIIASGNGTSGLIEVFTEVFIEKVD